MSTSLLRVFATLFLVPWPALAAQEPPSERVPLAPAAAAAAPIPADWSARVGEELARAEYRFTLAGGVAAAPNRAQGLRARVTPTGITVTPRELAEGASAWTLALELRAWGRGDARAPLGPGEVRIDAERAEIVRGAIREWYVNDERGIEQGFDLAQPPASGAEELVLELALEGGLAATIAEDGRSVELALASGEVVARYAGLLVLDADGRELAARIAAGDGALEIRVDDGGARYPLVIDPIISGAVWSVRGGQLGAELGFSVATAGDVNGDGFSDLVVGAPGMTHAGNDGGAAFVYHGSASGPSTAPAWSASLASPAEFGASVSCAGDVNGDGYDDVIVGAPAWMLGHGSGGRAAVYLGSAAGLAASPTWVRLGGQGGARFGAAVARAGDVNGDGYDDVLVGAPLHDAGNANEGRAYLYAGSPGGPSSDPIWIGESNQDEAYFGAALASAGDTNGDGYDDVLIGVPDWGITHNLFDVGLVRVYYGSSSGIAGGSTAITWAETGARLGTAVAGVGDVNGDGYADVLVGAPDYGPADRGYAAIHHGGASGVSTTAAWSSIYHTDGARFGAMVASAGDLNGDALADYVIGAPEAQSGKGLMSLYLGRIGQPPAFVTNLVGESAGHRFASSACSAGDVNGDGYGDLIVGAREYGLVWNDEGKAYLYTGSSAGVGTSAAWTSASAGGGSLGIGVASAGDVNGDGFSDVVLGAPYYDGGSGPIGRALVYHGGAGGLGSAPAWSALGASVASEFGFSVATAGDVNGDGYDDVIVGAPMEIGDQPYEGRAHVFLGSAAGLGASPAWSAERDNGGARFGHCVASAGDVNGDGFCDVLVGAPDYDDFVHADFGGEVSLYRGSASGLASGAAWIGRGGVTDAYYGASVASAGDVDGDGFDDVVVGAPRTTVQTFGDGRAFLYRGVAGGLASTPVWSFDGTSFGELGTSVASAGDVNGDGFADVIVGAPVEQTGGARFGVARVFHGSASGLPSQPSWSVADFTPDTSFGHSVAPAGDVDGDGFADALVGAPGDVIGGRYAALFRGTSLGLMSAPSWGDTGNAGEAFGWCVAGAGDVDGDGFADVLVGAPQRFAFAGEAVLHRGNDQVGGGLDAGLARLPRQRRGGAPLALHGRSPVSDAFRVAVLARSAAGRANVRLEWEAERVRRAFDGAGIGRSATSTDTGAPGSGGSAAEVSEVVSGLAQGSFYHWRVRTTCEHPFFPRSPWISMPGNGITQTKLRTSGRLALGFDH